MIATIEQPAYPQCRGTIAIDTHNEHGTHMSRVMVNMNFAENLAQIERAIQKRHVFFREWSPTTQDYMILPTVTVLEFLLRRHKHWKPDL